MEKTFIMVKPDGVERGLVGEVMSRIERKGYKINKAKLFKPSKSLVEEHYTEHRERDFFGELVDYIEGENVMAMEVEGEDVIQVMRLLIGNKDPKSASPGTIRGDLSSSLSQNIVHGSDSIESAKRELELWFKE